MSSISLQPTEPLPWPPTMRMCARWRMSTLLACRKNMCGWRLVECLLILSAALVAQLSGSSGLRADRAKLICMQINCCNLILSSSSLPFYRSRRAQRCRMWLIMPRKPSTPVRREHCYGRAAAMVLWKPFHAWKSWSATINCTSWPNWAVLSECRAVELSYLFPAIYLIYAMQTMLVVRRLTEESGVGAKHIPCIHILQSLDQIEAEADGWVVNKYEQNMQLLDHHCDVMSSMNSVLSRNRLPKDEDANSDVSMDNGQLAGPAIVPTSKPKESKKKKDFKNKHSMKQKNKKKNQSKFKSK